LQQSFPSAEFHDDGLGGQIDFKEILLSLYRHKFPIVGLALLGGLLAFYYSTTLQPVYKASGTLLIEQQTPSVVSIQDIYNSGYKDWENRETQFQLLRSRSLAERVVRKLELHKDPKYMAKPAIETNTEAEGAEDKGWFDFSSLTPAYYTKLPPREKVLTDEEKEQQLVTQLAQMISGGIAVSPVPDSKLAAISYSSGDPEFAAMVVNTLAEEFIESHLDANLETTLKSSQWLTDRLADLRENLKQAETRLQSYREQEQLVDVQGIATLSNQELSDRNQRYSAARETRQNLELIKREVDALKGASIKKYLEIPVIQKHSLISGLVQNLSDAERKLGELNKRYGVKHPKIISANSEVAVATTQIAEEMQKVIAGINTEYQLALETEQALQQQLDLSRSTVQDINRKEFEVQALQREVDTNRQLYDMFFTRLKETDQTQGFQNANARIIDRALVPTGPVSPDARMIIIFGLVGGMMLGAGVAVLLGLLDNTVKTPEDIESKLHAKVLGVLPVQKAKEDGFLELYWENNQSNFAEHVRTLRTGIVLGGLDTPLKIVVLTSSLPGEGKSIIALDLGAAFAHLEKTLVIGADMRRPTLASKCRFSPRHPGLSNYLAGSATLDECLVKVGDQELYVMPSGLIPTNPLEMLSSGKFREALVTLSAKFDRIIIDSAPIQAVSDALILTTYADTVVYVVGADSTSATVARKGIERIRATTVPMAGVILNRFDAQKAAKYYGTGEYGYSAYYHSDNAPTVKS
jgi:polysaccharide biosynthesis transport protein